MREQRRSEILRSDYARPPQQMTHSQARVVDVVVRAIGVLTVGEFETLPFSRDKNYSARSRSLITGNGAGARENRGGGGGSGSDDNDDDGDGRNGAGAGGVAVVMVAEENVGKVWR